MSYFCSGTMPFYTKLPLDKTFTNVLTVVITRWWSKAKGNSFVSCFSLCPNSVPRCNSFYIRKIKDKSWHLLWSHVHFVVHYYFIYESRYICLIRCHLFITTHSGTLVLISISTPFNRNKVYVPLNWLLKYKKNPILSYMFKS